MAHLHGAAMSQARRPAWSRLHIGMKTAVFIPDDVFERAKRFAKQAGWSRSEVFSAAMREYLARHAPDEVTDAMNRVCANQEEESDSFGGAAVRRVLERTKW